MPRRKQIKRPDCQFEHDLDPNNPVHQIVLEEAIKMAKLADHDYTNVPRKPIGRGKVTKSQQPAKNNQSAKNNQTAKTHQTSQPKRDTN